MSLQTTSKLLATALIFMTVMSITASAPADAKRPKVGFLASIEEPGGLDLTLFTRDGRELHGRITRHMNLFGSVTKLTFRTHEGEKLKLRADEIDRIEMPVNEIWRIAMVSSASDTLEEIWKSDFERIFEVETLEFHSVRHPKSERTALRQLINPGFDSRIRVYYLPSSKEGIFSSGDTAIFGDMPKAFLVVKDDGEPERVKQSEYRDEVFPRLYADCPELLERYQGDMRKFKFFAEHVFLYDQLCPGPGSPTYSAGSGPAGAGSAVP